MSFGLGWAWQYCHLWKRSNEKKCNVFLDPNIIFKMIYQPQKSPCSFLTYSLRCLSKQQLSIHKKKKYLFKQMSYLTDMRKVVDMVKMVDEYKWNKRWFSTHCDISKFRQPHWKTKKTVNPALNKWGRLTQIKVTKQRLLYLSELTFINSMNYDLNL